MPRVNTKKPHPSMLGTGAASKAATSVKKSQEKKKNRLDSVMQGLRRGRQNQVRTGR